MRHVKNYKISSFLKNILKEQRIIYVEEIPLPLNKNTWINLPNFGHSCWYELKRLVDNDLACIAIPYNNNCKNFKEIEFPRYKDVHLRNIELFKDKNLHKMSRKTLMYKYNLSEVGVKTALIKFKKEIINVLQYVELTHEQYSNFFCNDNFYMHYFKQYSKL